MQPSKETDESRREEEESAEEVVKNIAPPFSAVDIQLEKVVRFDDPVIENLAPAETSAEIAAPLAMDLIDENVESERAPLITKDAVLLMIIKEDVRDDARKVF